MAVDPVPYVVHGAKHSADVFRQAHYDATSGREGVSRAWNFHTKETQTPSSSVRVGAGGATILNSYQGGLGQSYSVRNASETLVEVPASDSTGAKSWKIIVRIEDPQFGGQSPADPLVGPYVFLECVDQSVNVSHPHLVLADIVVPASTATITNSMITDRRELANPGVWFEQRSYNLLSGDNETLGITDPGGEAYPNDAAFYMDIPDFAVEMSVTTRWTSVNYRGGNTWGVCWLEFGDYLGGSEWERSTQEARFNSDNATDARRATWECPDTVSIPASMRGKRVRFVPKARLEGGSGDARPNMDGLSGVIVQAYFREVPESD